MNTLPDPNQAPGAHTRDKASYPLNVSPMLRVLRFLTLILPGDHLRTFIYLNLIARPRRMLRRALFQFYRYDHVYAVLDEFKKRYAGRFSILEFGTSAGYSFVKLLFATVYLRMADRVSVHGFDSFEGMPATTDPRDLDYIGNDNWVEGEFRGDFDKLQNYCAKHYKNFELHKGYFDATLEPSLLERFKTEQPVLVWIDSDYYSSARTVMERLVPYLPSGCVLYFDEYDNMNYGSRLTGEARIVHEINHGLLGDDIELVLDTEHALHSRRVYRLVRLGEGPRYQPLNTDNTANLVRYPSNDSPLP